jgi:parallel beta-helix repeat protein
MRDMHIAGGMLALAGRPGMGVRDALRVLLVAVALSLAFAPGAHAAKAVHVSCGETITVDTRLANDLIDCQNNGLIIGADNITLDLNGHTIDGAGRDNSGADCRDGNCAGIDITGHHRRITIEDGTVQEFGSGIWIEGGADHRLRRLSLSRNGDGIDVVSATDTAITRSLVDGNVFGIFVADSDHIQIERNSVSGYQGVGVEVRGSDRVLIADNSVSDSLGPGSVVVGEAAGIFLGESSHSQIERNAVSGNAFVGVIAQDSDRNELSGNRIFKNADAMIVHGDANTVSGNRISDALGGGDGNGYGIVLESGRKNVLERNTVERTAQAGIRVGIDPEPPPVIGSVVRLNVIRDTTLDGILVDALASDTLLDRNRAETAGDDGIGVESASTTLTRNTANANHDLGIEAIPGITDGGGNKASGNGNPLQCTNVFCR